MAANRIIGDYYPGFFTSGILYNGENGLPRFSTRNGQTTNIPIPQGINHPINICSSSHGLIACHDPISNIYYIGNPRYPDSYIPLPQTPRPHDPQHTHVVLATEFFGPPIFHLICAIDTLNSNIYTFDTFTSASGHWRSYRMINVGGKIIPNTGVSCGPFAYWLTEVPRSITRFDVYNPKKILQTLLFNVVPPVPDTWMQLGRVGKQPAVLYLSLEGSSYPRVTLCCLQEGNPGLWRTYSHSANLLIPNPSQFIPRPIRFQSYYVEVFFWANGRLMIWNIIDVQMLNEEGVQAADGIAHINTALCPENFPRLT